MPPRPRGRASVRARGGGRGGAAVGQSASSVDEDIELATPQTSTPTIAADVEAQPVVPKQEMDEDTKPPVVGGDTATAIELQASSSLAASNADATPQNGAESTPRASVQRIGSLQGSVPPSRSASPSVRGRGSTTRGKRGMVKPTFTGRRSKEEREAMEKEAKERDRLRNLERAAADKRKQRDAENAAKREARNAAKARGGYSGAVSGPFSLGSSKEDRKSNPNRGISSFGSGSGSRAVRVKNEDDSYAGSSGRSGGGGPSIKREDGGYVSSSEEEDDKEFPRRDIDLIEISDDENESKDNVVSTQRHSRATLPVRIGRKEHQERAFGINTDASTESSAKTVAQAEATGQGSASESTVRKGKGKARDMEITGERKPFRGVWQDGDDADVAIKAEVISDDENMGDAEQVGIADSLTRPAEKLEPPSPGAERKPKPKIKSIAEPVLQTEEDRAEWARFQTNLQHIRAELGPDESSTADGSGDVQMAESGNNVKKPTVRDNNVYLFQIPPLMPELLTDSIKKEPSDEQSSLAAPTPVPGPVQAANPGPKVKLEEGGFSDPSAKTSDGPRFASGMVGKLRVRQSGRTTLDWGGTSYELTPGNRASFLQEVVSVRIDAEKDRVVPEDAGDAISFGRVKGKFVVVPDWTSMLGQ